jgi:hypothetical protein
VRSLCEGGLKKLVLSKPSFRCNNDHVVVDSLEINIIKSLGGEYMNYKQNRSISNLIVFLTFVSLIAVGCNPAVTASPTAIPPTLTPMPPTAIPTPDLISLVKAYEEAFNAHDLEATVALFNDLAVYSLA